MLSSQPSQETIDTIQKLKNDPTIEADVGTECSCSMSFRGGEWVVTLEGERFTESEEGYHSIVVESIETSCVIRNIAYCENCGKELQIQCMGICECDLD